MINRSTLPRERGSRAFNFVIQLLLGGFLVFMAGIWCYFGSFQFGEQRKGGRIITPASDPFGFWIFISGLALIGLVIVVVATVRFANASKGEKDKK